MNAQAAEKRKMSPAEYLALERSSRDKHEYCDGEVFAMAGASREHNLIVANVVGELRAALRHRPCEVYPSDMRLKVPAAGTYSYPDASALCGSAEFEDAEVDTLLNPAVIVEVLSESTEDYDRGTKFKNYRSIPSFREYVVVSQTEVLVEHHVRQADGSWLMREHRAGERFELSALACDLAVDELYLKVFAGGAEAPARAD
jgi:Uma2 family endonuclease